MYTYVERKMDSLREKTLLSCFFTNDTTHADFKDDAVHVNNFAAKLFCDKQTNFSN